MDFLPTVSIFPTPAQTGRPALSAVRWGMPVLRRPEWNTSMRMLPTPAGDITEAEAIYDVFGGKVPVSSTKSMTGHECWMAGASEIVYSMLMMQGGFIAPNINFEHPDEHSAKI